MKQIAQNYRSGELVVLDVPAPACKPGGVLIRSLFSLISTGTEMMKVTEARLSLIGKARARPDQVRKLMDSVAQQGPVATYQKAMNRLDSYTPLGYSLCGVVVEVGAGAEEFAVGDLVAAAGNEFALHAEVNWVPINLCVPVPDGVAPEHAAFATVGAIAMQGVRRGEVQIGETACVVGLGLVGQLVVRLLVAAGVRVVGVDTVEARCRMAEKAGALACAGPDAEGVAQIEGVLRAATGGLGADHIFLAAGGSSNGPVELAARLARDRARVVDIGKTRLDLPWNEYYEKELDVRFSRSYGPGRYDDRYELEGIDYPAGYVRWTERRNLGCFLDLIANESIDVGPLVSGIHPIADATDVYDQLREGQLNGVGFLLEYPQPEVAADQAVAAPVRTLRSAPSKARQRPAVPGGPTVRLGFIGAGNYAASMLLPHLAKDPAATLVSVATTRSLSGVNAQRKFGFDTVTTDVEVVLDDPSIDAVFVVTRHHSHADFVCQALERGKAVFVEKPLALTDDQVERILETVARTGNDRLMVGFNRRFAPLFTDLQRRFGPIDAPVSARYLVNAGRLEPDSWYTNEELEGTRFVGEGGHFIDTLTAWIGHRPVEVHAHRTPGGGDLHLTLRFADGSLGSVTYASGGNSRFPKETFDVSGGGRNARLGQLLPGDGLDQGRQGRQACADRSGQGPASAAGAVRCCHQDRCTDADRAGLTGRDDAGDDRDRGEPRDWIVCDAMSRSLAWYARRLKQMSPEEMAQRGLDQVRRSTWASRQVPVGGTVGGPPGILANREFASAVPFDERSRVSTETRDAVVAAADRLLAGEWSLLGQARPDIAAPDWFLDPISGTRAPQERLAFSIDHRDESETGNVKAVWELSRHHHLTVLASAWWLTHDDAYADLVAGQLRSWWRENPFLSGVHWTSGIELGVRLTSWVWIRRLLDEWPKVGDLFETNDDALRQIWWHQRFLSAFHSRGSSGNNHAVAEAVGQLVAACAFPWYAESQRWRVEAAQRLERSLAANTFESGVNRELATDYHRFVTELGLVAAVEADSAGHPLGSATWALLTASLDAAAWMLDETGRPPRQGDGDEGRALVVDDPDEDPWAGLLAIGAAVVGPQPWWPETSDSVEAHLLGALAARRARRTGSAEPPSAMADAGMFVLRTPPEDGPEIWCRCDGGPHGYLSIAAHAHADALSVEVRYGGVDVLADPGTYCYHGEPEWRSYFRSTRAHNTIELGGANQSVEGGPFLWTTQAETTVKEAAPGAGHGSQTWSGQHSGYLRLKVPAVHGRTVTLEPSSRHVSIVDRVTSRGVVPLRMTLHLGPAVTARMNGTVAELTWQTDDGEVSADLHLPSQLRWTAHRGETDPILGWYSPRFGERVPTTALLGTGACERELELRTLLVFPSA